MSPKTGMERATSSCTIIKASDIPKEYKDNGIREKQERSLHSFRSPPDCGQFKTEAKEKLDKQHYKSSTQSFKIALSNRFQALQDLLKEEETSMENNCKCIKEALALTCQEVLGLKKHHHKEWISIKTLDKIKERKNKKTAINNSRRREEVKSQAEYSEANTLVKKSI
ncbi:unnamed protein product [Schistosoma mattheei]|uniref:Uncharacterized protein n=1 Tax=Schistosoma mattheei TaxID=31246 RepID=A0A183PLX4_9TREM|nr:unnamed protein product [Schistosoma mattheei]